MTLTHSDITPGATTDRPLAVVTGASSGIGYELARELAEHGFDLVVAAEDAELADAAQRLAAVGGNVLTAQVDLTTADGVEQLYDRIRATGRSVEALCLNAGIGAEGPFATGPDVAAQLRVVDLNVRSAVHLARRVLPDMVAAGHGRVMFTSSIAATMPGPFEAVYAASKAFLYSFSEALRNELKDSGVTVTALLPGPTETEFFDRAGMEDTRAGQGPKDDAADVARRGYEAMMKGEDQVFGSGKVKLQQLAGKVVPEKLKAAAHRKLMEPGSGSDS